jgi:hypothetical protein
MALINGLEKGFKNRENIHKNTSGIYFIVTDKRGNKYLQIDTDGTLDRAIPGKVSQSLQFSPEAIKQLKKILTTEF